MLFSSHFTTKEKTPCFSARMQVRHFLFQDSAKNLLQSDLLYFTVNLTIYFYNTQDLYPNIQTSALLINLFYAKLTLYIKCTPAKRNYYSQFYQYKMTALYKDKCICYGYKTINHPKPNILGRY